MDQWLNAREEGIAKDEVISSLGWIWLKWQDNIDTENDLSAEAWYTHAVCWHNLVLV